MITYNELGWAVCYKVVRHDDLFLLKTLTLKRRLSMKKLVGDGVKIEKDESPKLYDFSLNLRTGWLKYISELYKFLR